MSDSQPESTDRTDGSIDDADADTEAEQPDSQEPVSFKDWFESFSEQTGVDPDDVENYAVVWVFDTDSGGQEAATAWAIDGHTVPTMALSNGLTAVAGQLDMLASQMRAPTDAPKRTQMKPRGFD